MCILYVDAEYFCVSYVGILCNHTFSNNINFVRNHIFSLNLPFPLV